jgi:hypothetical protein
MILASATVVAARQPPDARDVSRPAADSPLPKLDGPPAPVPSDVIDRDATVVPDV